MQNRVFTAVLEGVYNWWISNLEEKHLEMGRDISGNDKQIKNNVSSCK